MLESEPRSDEGDGGSRRRRRRGGRGGADRPDRGDRPPRESFGGQHASSADANETRAAESQHARDNAPVHEPVSERTEPTPPVHEPVKPAYTSTPVFTSAPVAFQAVSEHSESDTEMHRPQRRRKHSASEQASQQSELQLVETQFDAPAIPAVEDELPRRTKPRRRHSAPVDAEPLKLVETEGPAETQRPENTPTP